MDKKWMISLKDDIYTMNKFHNNYNFQESDDKTCWYCATRDKYEGIAISKTSKRVSIFIGDGVNYASDAAMIMLYSMMKDDMLEIKEAKFIGEE